MHINGKAFRTIWFENNIVKIIDQTKLPHQFIIKDLKTVKDSVNAIKTMEVRGAPLIGATAAYGLVLAIIEKNDQSFLKKASEDLIKSRPTAINLKWAVDRMMKKLSGVNSSEILKIAINEAYTLGIPVFGMVDTNTDPTAINYPIPSNDDSIKSINAIVGYIADVVLEAKGMNKSDESVPHQDADDSNKKSNEGAK